MAEKRHAEQREKQLLSEKQMESEVSLLMSRLRRLKPIIMLQCVCVHSVT